MTGDVDHSERPPGLPSRYRITEVVGRGSFATVFKALDKTTDTVVALKVLHAQYVKSDKHSRRFEREVRVCQRLNHPNIIKVHSAMVTEQSAYLVMEFLEAQTLADLISDNKVILAESFRIIAQVASALDYVHDRGLVHRDIKPDNIMVCPQTMRTVLTDFNLVRLPFRSSLSGTGDALGTPYFVAPEVVMGADASAASDIYAMGLVFYELLAGTKAYPYKAMGKLLRAICNEEPARPSSVRPGLSTKLDSVVAQAMAKEPAKRFPSAASFLTALAAADSRGKTAVESVRPHTPGLSRPAPLQLGHRLLRVLREHPQHVAVSLLVMTLIFLLAMAVW